MLIVKAIIVAALLLIAGDLLSTFCDRVPKHVFGKFHTIVHYEKNRSFDNYAVLSGKPLVVLDGFCREK